jgi:hypothetical protein
MFKSNAVRSCVELNEIELNRFYDAWQTSGGRTRASHLWCRFAKCVIVQRVVPRAADQLRVP